MKIQKKVWRREGVIMTMELIENDEPSLHDYGLSRSSWLRAVNFMKRFGATEALKIIDSRAMRAVERGDLETCRRWRDLITAIHAIEEDELSPGDRMN